MLTLCQRFSVLGLSDEHFVIMECARPISLAVAEDLDDDDCDDPDTSLCSTFPTTEHDSSLNPEIGAGSNDGGKAKKYVVKVYLTKKNDGEGKSTGVGIGNDRKGSAAAASVCATAVASSDEEVRLPASHNFQNATANVF